ncbi:MAG: hypothetical protein II540_02065, partial [Paludibacteraceae bacterium]|nr:hypothetical protein [Paludibacteraceae bacterium]
ILQKNEGKNAFFFKNICVCQKKAVLLHSVLNEARFYALLGRGRFSRLTGDRSGCYRLVA